MKFFKVREHLILKKRYGKSEFNTAHFIQLVAGKKFHLNDGCCCFPFWREADAGGRYSTVSDRVWSENFKN